MKKTITTIFTAITFTLSMYSQTWAPLTSGTTQNLTGVSFASDNVGWAAGFGGTILKTTDGTTFTAQSSGTTNNFYGVCFIDANTGFAVGDASTIVKTTNGGTTWSTVSSPVTADFRKVWFLTASIGFITGGVTNTSAAVLKTTDGGNTWTALNTGLSNVVYGIYFTDPMTGYACDFVGDIIKTTDGGTTWNLQTSGVTIDICDIYFSNSTTGIATCINGVMLRTTDAGITWTQLSSITTDWYIYTRFTSQYIGYSVGGNVGGNANGDIYKTTDGGATWTLNYTSNANRLYGFSFKGHSAYACGLNGTILKISGLSGEGINEITNFVSCNVYPNPSNGKFQITINDNSNKRTIVKVFNSIGEIIYSEEKQTNNFLLDLSNQAKGTYFVQITDENKNVANKKIVIQ